MANRIVTAAVTGESIKLSSKNAGAAGSDRAVSLAITFDSTWDSTPSKIVQFLDTNGQNPTNITLTSGMIVGGAYIVPIRSEPLKYAGEITFTVRGVEFETDGTTIKRVIMSASTTMNVQNSLYNVNGAAPVEPTPTQAEQLLASVNSVTAMTATATTLATGAPATVTKTNNPNGTINLAFGLPAGGKGDTGTKGDTGATGNGISSVTLNPDYTLTINYTNSTSVTTTSIRGATGATGAKGDTGATGNGIASVVLLSGTHAAGTTDTYRITFTDATTFDFTVYNGANGIGAGDMLASVYDPTAKNADAFSMANMVEGTTNKIFTATERTKLSGIATGAEVNVQSDWNVTDDTSDAFIKNKPTLSAPADTTTTLSDPVKTALALTGTKYVSDALTKLSGAALRKKAKISELANGTTFKLNETGDGTMVNFVKLTNDYEGTGRVAVCRKSNISNSVWGSGSQTYATSTLHTALNTTYYGTLSNTLQSAISAVTIDVFDGSTVNTLSAKVFAPSKKEVFNSGTDGDYIAALNALKSSISFWTRTTWDNDVTYAFSNVAGTITSKPKTESYNVLPMFTLPADFEIEGFNSLVDMLGNKFVVGAQIAVGSYVGTGSAQTLTFDFVPQLIFIDNAISGFSVSGNTATITGNNTSGTTYSYKALG